ncbi:MAG: hypothetical protein K6E30_00735 [Lachnospiraceae bacterium]|nr:hypothetical protein [Lachnospiraceae bacterium]
MMNPVFQRIRAEGRLESVIDLSLRKYRRGWSVEKAADALEKEPGEIAEIYGAIKACGAGSTPEDILKWMEENKDMAPAAIYMTTAAPPCTPSPPATWTTPKRSTAPRH